MKLRQKHIQHSLNKINSTMVEMTWSPRSSSQPHDCLDKIDNKKDGYRQQNVRQPQKLISIIDYDVCILEYLQPFWRYPTSKNGMVWYSRV